METQTNNQNSSIFSTDSEFIVSLLSNEELEVELGENSNEAQAALLKNPAVSWAKFVLTDDQPNGNKQRVPLEEFDNLIKSGVFMPLKMARGSINPGHDKSEPLGVITNLKKSGNKILALAALWQRERKEDVDYLKALAKQNKSIDISWEILYEDSKPSEEFEGVQDLSSTSLRAATIVGVPAYGGRTQMLALAAAWSKPYLEKLPDENFLIVEDTENGKTKLFPYRDIDGNVDIEKLNFAKSNLNIMSGNGLEQLSKETIQKAQNKVAELLEATSSIKEENIITEDKTLDELETLKSKVEELTTALTETKANLLEKETKLGELEPQLVELTEFKQTIEKQAVDTIKFEAIKQKFADASIEKDPSYFDEHKEFLLGLDEKALDFTIQELVSFAESSQKGTKQSNASTKVPNLLNNKSTDIKSLVEELRKNSNKK